jgi:DNA-binding XRE family transcriptional regulator
MAKKHGLRFRGTKAMTADDYRQAMIDLGLTQNEAADFLGVSLRTAHGYANEQPVPLCVAKLLRLCVRLKLAPEDVK